MTTSTPTTDPIRALLRAQRDGDSAARRELFDRMYRELRAIAARRIANERVDHTEQPTSLVHEVFLRLGGRALDCRDRGEFLRLAAAVMRHLLVDNARRHRLRRDVPRAVGREVGLPHRDDAALASRIDVALSRLARVDEDLVRVVELRYLVGLRVEEVAEVLGVSTATVKRDWRTARAFLHGVITGDDL